MAAAAIVGYAKAAELVFIGETILAKEALDLGLVNRVVPEGGALDAAIEMANKIAATRRLRCGRPSACSAWPA